MSGRWRPALYPAIFRIVRQWTGPGFEDLLIPFVGPGDGGIPGKIEVLSGVLSGFAQGLPVAAGFEQYLGAGICVFFRQIPVFSMDYTLGRAASPYEQGGAVAGGGLLDHDARGVVG